LKQGTSAKYLPPRTSPVWRLSSDGAIARAFSLTVETLRPLWGARNEDPATRGPGRKLRVPSEPMTPDDKI
jgi:hypothetical protein